MELWKLTPILLLAGCASYTPRESAWEALEPVSGGEVQEALEYPEWPEIAVEGSQAVLSEAGLRRLAEIRELAEANRELAQVHAERIQALEQAHDSLVRAGQSEYELAELRGRLLEEERRARLWDKLTYGGLALLGVILGLR